MNCLPAEDRTCRMCGYADQQNINLYSKDVHKKILALYPIILYKTDPLPKNICMKCYANVCLRYEEYQRITKIQNKWITNVRNNQPDNPYIRILDKIDLVNVVVTQTLSNITPDFHKEGFQIVKFNTNFPSDISIPPQQNYYSQPSNNFSSTFPTLNSNEGSHLPLRMSQQLSKETPISKLQSLLESNGCSLSPQQPKSKVKKLTRPIGPRFFMNRLNSLQNKCNYCSRRFFNQKILAKHQLTHVKILLFRCFDRKPLIKKLFNGRLVLINNIQCLRCSNCWKLYRNGSEILKHWRQAECDFYCKLCGDEFAINPRQLREHIKQVHEINYKLYLNFTEDIVKSYRPVFDEFEHDLFDDEDPLLSYEKLPILKLKRKTNAEHEFDIKMITEDDLNDKNESSKIAPLLRVKNLSELQGPSSRNDNNFSSFSDLKLNTLSLL